MIRHLTVSRAALAALAFSLAASAGQAHEFKAGELTIDHPWTRATPAGAQTAGGYAKITNHGTEADTLTGGFATGAEKVEVHEMKMENNVMKMRALEGGLTIKPGETVELKPGSYHFMMMGLKEPYKEGEMVKGTLVFEKAGKVDVEFKVEALGAKESQGMSHDMKHDMGHGDGHAAGGDHKAHKGH